MSVQALSDGTLVVVEQVVFGPRGVREMALQVPALPANLRASTAAGLRPTVRRLKVQVNGTDVTPDRTGDQSWTVTAEQGRARWVRLSYRLTGTTSRSQGSLSGRASSMLVPLLGDTLRREGLPMVVRARGAWLTQMSCVGAPTAGQLCAEQEGDVWTAPLGSDLSSSMVQLALNLTKAPRAR
jgi:hypothetical protein